MLIFSKYIQFKYFYISTVKRNFKKHLGYELNLENPQTFNEKLHWLKINYKDDLMTKYADKYYVRQLVKEKLGPEYLIELYGVYNSVDEIDLEVLPSEFVFKPTHSSGRVIISKNKEDINWKKSFKEMNRWLRDNYFYQSGEWVYKNIQPKIICEKLLEENIIDYKVYCFNGEPLFTQVISNRKNGKFNVNYYDLDWQAIEIRRKDHDENKSGINKPINYEHMLKNSKLIASNFPFARMDFYEVDNKLFFGEVTFFPANGLINFSDLDEDRKWGSYLTLPVEKHFNKL